jgi:hypothetical protein
MTTVLYDDVVDDIREKGYAAVSHVWGDQEMYSVAEFKISGADWEIPLSDPNKIPFVVNAMKFYGKEYCWFDILCMPQDKQEEINLEIPFMGDYYSGADVTFVLSTSEHPSSRAFLEWYDTVSDAMKSQREFTPEEILWIDDHPHDLLDISEDRKKRDDGIFSFENVDR